MAAPARIIKVAADCAFKIKKIKVRMGQDISKGTLLCLYTSGSNSVNKFKSCHGGTINNIHVKEGQDVKEGFVMFTLEGCTHPTVMKDMCASCGVDLRLENSTAGNRKEDVTASVAMVHSIPELIISEQMAKELGKADLDRLLTNRKLVLLVDLDQTIIHTTIDNIPPNLKGVKHFQLWHGNQLMWHHTKFRPGTQHFLEEISRLFELHICTFGSRMYAHTIAKLLDPEGKFFSNRILSRDECFDANLKTANLKALFPCGDAMVCIIDDREDVWNFVPNLVHVKPYRFFEGTADINAPPGLAKTGEIGSGDGAEPQNEEDNNNSEEKDNDEKEAITVKEESNGDIDSLKEKGDEDSVNKKNKSEINESMTGIEPIISENQDLSQVRESKNEVMEVSGDDQNLVETTEAVDEDNVKMELNSDQEKIISQENKTVENGTEAIEKNDNYNGSSEKVSVISNEEKSDNIGNSEKDENVSKDDSVKDIDNTNKSLNSEQKTENVKAIHTNKETNESSQDVSKEKTKLDDKGNSEKDKNVSKDDSVKDIDNTDKGLNSEQNTENVKAIHTNKETNESSQDVSKEKTKDEIEWEDHDDYLFYLEDILKNIHRAFYDMFDQTQQKDPDETKSNPSLKDIIPYMKKKVLKGCNIVFSGIIPTNMQMEKNRAYIMATALGANIQQEIKHSSNEKDPKNHTTHLIAARVGTSKVRTAIKYKKIKVVTVKWLWSCYERWEKVEEGLFLDIPNTRLSPDGRDSPDPSKFAGTKRKSEAKDNSGAKKAKIEERDTLVDSTAENNTDKEQLETAEPGTSNTDKKANEAKPETFSMTYNPLYAFSDDDIAHMDKEVEDEIEDEDESSEEEEDRNERIRKHVLRVKRPFEEESSEDSMTGDMPRGWGLKGKTSPKWSSSSDDEDKHSCPRELGPEYESETDQDKFEKIMEAFGPITSSDEEYQESVGSVDEEIADAVMKEFLS